MEGELPSSERIQKVFLVGAMESLLNAHQHGKATQMRIAVLTNKPRRTVLFRFTNNGALPADRVQMGGGLALVRAAAEDAKGSVRWIDHPEFTLEIELPLP